VSPAADNPDPGLRVHEYLARRGLWIGTVVFTSVATCYLVGAWLAVYLLSVSGLGAVLFAPAGVTISAMLLLRRHHWPAVLMAAFSAEMFMDLVQGIEFRPTVGFATANTIEPLVGAMVTLWLVPNVDLSRRRSLAAAGLGAVLVGPAVGALIGAGTVGLSGGPFWSVLFGWWLGDGVGVLLVGGLLLTLVTSADRDRLTAFDSLAMMTLTCTLAFALHWWVGLSVGFIVLLPVVVIGGRVGSSGAAVISSLVAVISIFAFLYSNTSIPLIETGSGFVLVKLQLATIAIAGLVVAAEARERDVVTRRSAYQLGAIEHLRDALSPATQLHGEHFVAEGRCKPVNRQLDVGGDWYDVHEDPAGVVHILIGDAVGHDEESVIFMGKLRFAAAAFAMLDEPPGLLLDRLEGYAMQIEGTYATVFAARYDTRNGEFSYASAGHPPPLLQLDSGDWAWLDGAKSRPIGAVSGTARVTQTIQIDAPSRLIVYTDGLIERRGEGLDAGLDRLFERVTAEADHGRLADVLTSEVESGSNDTDDIALVTIDLRPHTVRTSPIKIGHQSGSVDPLVR
jgi:serine phosphatase RsbU (regulator of sigma subunit)